ncbi:MAG: fructosamine kinase family protein [Methylovulum sp.]|nr:fructosamine kinase family protein [Methylovulum sp.]
MNWQIISEHITSATGQRFKIMSTHPITGGDINSAFRLQGDSKAYFIKLNHANLEAMFAAEFAGLQELASTQTLRVPLPIVYGTTQNHSFLVLEYLALGASSRKSECLLGQQLASLHQQPKAYFGWGTDNTIGRTPQFNQCCADWPIFWREQRLKTQLEFAAKQGYKGNLQTLGEQLCDGFAALFTTYQPQPSLVHGDLWAGNVAADQQGRPVIFDPACYYGDRETDLAMTELFGGFSADFYAAYQDVWPLDEGYGIRKTLYNLYHVLNHLNLFGIGYLRQAENIMAKLLAELR